MLIEVGHTYLSAPSPAPPQPTRSSVSACHSVHDTTGRSPVVSANTGRSTIVKLHRKMYIAYIYKIIRIIYTIYEPDSRFMITGHSVARPLTESPTHEFTDCRVDSLTHSLTQSLNRVRLVR